MNKKLSKGAFTLIELVILLALSGIILFAVSRLTKETYQTLIFLREKAQTYEGAVLGIERLTSDMRGAVGTLSITAGGERIEFTKVRPALGMARGDSTLPNPERPYPAKPYPLPNTPPLYEPPGGPYTDLVTVAYELSGETVNRQVGAFESAVAEDVAGFNVTQEGPLPVSFKVVLSIQEKRRVISFESFVRCPGLAP